jgi:hypothetical protein
MLARVIENDSERPTGLGWIFSRLGLGQGNDLAEPYRTGVSTYASAPRRPDRLDKVADAASRTSTGARQVRSCTVALVFLAWAPRTLRTRTRGAAARA